MSARRGRGEGSIFYEDARSRWVGRLELPDDGTGKRRRAKVVGRTKTEVRDKLKELQRQTDAGLPVGNGSETLGVFLDRWLEDVLPARGRVRSPNTLTNYRWAVDCHIRPALGSKRLRALTPDDVERLLRNLAERGMARNTIMRVRSVLVMALKHAQRRDMVARNVAELAEMPHDATKVKAGRSLILEEARRLLDVADGHRLGALVTTALMLGLRPGEVTGLRWSDVDLDAGVLRVTQARKREQDADGHEVLTFGDPKTPRSRRALNLPAPVVVALRQHLKSQAAERLACHTWHDHDLVFPTSVGTPMSPSNLRRDFATLTEAAGLGRWTPNELRHSAGSLLSASGVPLEQVADVLGHTDTRMLERVYRHPVTSTVAAAAAPMERLFGA